MVKSRNEILMILKECNEFLYTDDLYESYGVKDFIALTKLSHRLSTLPQMNIHNLLKLQKRDSSSDLYDSYQLSDIDE